jgi:hypothetical protein
VGNVPEKSSAAMHQAVSKRGFPDMGSRIHQQLQTGVLQQIYC